MSTVQSEKSGHQTTCNLSEATRQADAAAATKAFNLGGTQAAYDAAMKAADAAHFRRVIASCVANGVDAGVFRQGLHDLTGLWA
jgi:bifunctional pyridoxal-dependent enzyme with beta-cystathionase and maltose regulon repressor activities